jgi:hypothetical protein
MSRAVIAAVAAALLAVLLASPARANHCTWDGIPRDNPADGIVCHPQAEHGGPKTDPAPPMTQAATPGQASRCTWDGIPRDNPAEGVVCRPRAVAPSALPTPQAPLAVAPDGIIRYTPGRPIIAIVTLNGLTKARLILDTGADCSMVRPGVLAAAGVDLSRPAARGKVVGVAGEAKVSYFSVDFDVVGHRARLPEVMAHAQANDNSDGLLGRDFLDRFKVVMDPAAGTVTLTPK